MTFNVGPYNHNEDHYRSILCIYVLKIKPIALFNGLSINITVTMNEINLPFWNTCLPGYSKDAQIHDLD